MWAENSSLRELHAAYSKVVKLGWLSLAIDGVYVGSGISLPGAAAIWSESSTTDRGEAINVE